MVFYVVATTFGLLGLDKQAWINNEQNGEVRTKYLLLMLQWQLYVQL